MFNFFLKDNESSQRRRSSRRCKKPRRHQQSLWSWARPYGSRRYQRHTTEDTWSLMGDENEEHQIEEDIDYHTPAHVSKQKQAGPIKASMSYDEISSQISGPGPATLLFWKDNVSTLTKPSHAPDPTTPDRRDSPATTAVPSLSPQSMPGFSTFPLRADLDDVSFQDSIESMDSLAESYWDPEDCDDGDASVRRIELLATNKQSFLMEHIQFLSVQTQPRQVQLVYNTDA